MSRCKDVCRACDNFIVSQAVTFAGGSLIINIPDGSYANNRKVCIYVAQTIPNITTINAPVFITIGTGATQYPLTKRNCRQVTACSLRTRTKYSTYVETTPTGGLFRLLGNVCCAPNNNRSALTSAAPVTEEPTEPANVAAKTGGK